MALRVPDRVREVWGDEMVVEMGPWLQELIQEYGVPRDEYREVVSRLDGLEKDTSLIKEELGGLRVEVGQLRDQLRTEFSEGQAQLRTEFREDMGELRREMNERFDRVNIRFDEMGARSEGRFDEMNQRFDEMGARFEGRFDEMNHRLLVQTRWLIGSLAVLGTVISVLLAIAQFAP